MKKDKRANRKNEERMDEKRKDERERRERMRLVVIISYRQTIFVESMEKSKK